MKNSYTQKCSPLSGRFCGAVRKKSADIGISALAEAAQITEDRLLSIITGSVKMLPREEYDRLTMALCGLGGR